jgi:hypothetical protein
LDPTVPDTSFLERLKSHRGGLVRVLAQRNSAVSLDQWNNKLCLLLDARRWGSATTVVEVELLADGRVIRLWLVPREIEFLGGEERDR